jgi:endogenous inhibitor of DNA gyrase (YacG/DUF329 family)
MIRGKCPICSAGYEIASLDDLPSFPFCTDRCKLIDLGRWVDAKYVIPVKPGPSDSDEDADETVGEAEEYEE